MKRLIFIMAILCVGLITAQEKSKAKKVDIAVRGNCDMCKKRIEKAAYATKGVKMAEWHQDDEVLHLVINEHKTDIMTVQKNIAAVGHTTQDVKATKAAYEKLHSCCQYENPGSCSSKGEKEQ